MCIRDRFDTVVVTSRRDLRNFNRDQERSGPPPGESRVLDEATRQAIEHLPNVLEAYPDIRFITELRYEDKPHLTMVAALPTSAQSNDAFEALQGRFFSSDTAPEVVLQKTFAEELLGRAPQAGLDETNVAELAAPLLGRELTMRYAQRQSAPAESSSAGKASAAEDPGLASAAYSVVSRELKLKIVGVADLDPESMRGPARARVFLPLKLAESLHVMQPSDLREVSRAPGDQPVYSSVSVRVKNPSDVQRVEDSIKKMGFNTFSILDASRSIQQFFKAVSYTHLDVYKRQVLGDIVGRIEFDHVSFTYDGVHDVLRDISFRADPGTVTALVGSSGSGKSTTIGLISAFYVPTKGQILLDGIDLSTVRLDSYRTRLGVVLQESFLFDGTIRENVRFSRPQAMEEEILRACRIARVDEFAETFTDKYETVVGERGVKLSGGQRQRISIARAILAEPRILILDEATSSLDSESEQMIQQGLFYLMKGRTTFVIAHRLSTIRRADQILVMEQGEIVERGTHQQLYAARGRYYDLYTRQHGVEENLFLAPGEGDLLEIDTQGNGSSGQAHPGDGKSADALRVLKGEVR